MYRTILVPLDGTAQAEWALPTAVSIAGATGASISLLTVDIPVPIMSVGLSVLESDERPVSHAPDAAYLQKVADRIRAAGVSAVVIGVVESAETAVSALGTEIAHRADIAHADLIVMTTHARAPLPQLFMGSVARDVVRTSRSPVLLVKPRPEGVSFLTVAEPFRHILVPLDGSSFSEEVLGGAVQLGNAGGARYTLINVVEVQRIAGVPVEPVLLPVDENVLRELTAAAQVRLDRVADRMRQRGLDVVTRIVHDGAPAEAIVRAAQQLDADLIAMTTHARSNFGSLVLGSVANHVIRAATAPVLLYRPREA